MKNVILLSAILMLVTFIEAGTWTVLDAPGADRTHIMDIEGSNIVGFYEADDGWHGFLHNLESNEWTILDAPGVGVDTGQATQVNGIQGENLVGYYSTNTGIPNGFIYNTTTQDWTILNDPEATNTRPFAIDNSNILGWGQFSNELRTSGIIFDGDNWTKLSFPDSQESYLYDIDGNIAVGKVQTGPLTCRGTIFDMETNNWNVLDAPGATQTEIHGVDGNNLVGIYYDGSEGHGFLFNGLEWTSLDAPGETSTYIGTYVKGIDGDNIVGYYYDSDSNPHGFIYTIPEPATLLLFGLGGLILRKRK